MHIPEENVRPILLQPNYLGGLQGKLLKKFLAMPQFIKLMNISHPVLISASRESLMVDYDAATLSNSHSNTNFYWNSSTIPKHLEGLAGAESVIIKQKKDLLEST